MSPAASRNNGTDMNGNTHDAFARALSAPDADDDEDDFGSDGNVAREGRWHAPGAARRARHARSRYGRGFDASTLATVAECEAALAEVGEEIAEIRRQLAAAAEEPEAVDPDWLPRAQGALRGKAIVREDIRARLGELRGDPRPKARPQLGDAPDLPETAFPVGYDVAALPTSAACADAAEVLLAEMAALRALVASTAGLAPRDWGLRAHAEVRRLGVLRQRVQDRRGILRREESRAAYEEARGKVEDDWRKRFVRAARATLDTETYEALRRMADAPEEPE